MAVGDLKQPSHCLRRCHCGCRGVELGKKLATACRNTIDGIYSPQCISLACARARARVCVCPTHTFYGAGSRKGADASADALTAAGFTSATAKLMAKFLA